MKIFYDHFIYIFPTLELKISIFCIKITNSFHFLHFYFILFQVFILSFYFKLLFPLNLIVILIKPINEFQKKKIIKNERRATISFNEAKTNNHAFLKKKKIITTFNYLFVYLVIIITLSYLTKNYFV